MYTETYAHTRTFQLARLKHFNSLQNTNYDASAVTYNIYEIVRTTERSHAICYLTESSIILFVHIFVQRR